MSNVMMHAKTPIDSISGEVSKRLNEVRARIHR